MPPKIRIKNIFRDKKIKEPAEEDYKREGNYNIFFFECMSINKNQTRSPGSDFNKI
jgi:hypothetical protein